MKTKLRKVAIPVQERKLRAFRAQADVGNALAQLEYCITKALQPTFPADGLAAVMADESVYDATRKLVQAGRNAGLLYFKPFDETICEHGYAQGCRACDPDGVRG